MEPSEQRALVDRYIAAYNAFDIDGLMAAIHADIEFENISGGEVTARASGQSEFRALAERSAEMFSLREQSIRTFLPGPDRATIEVVWEGVLARDLPGGPSAGEQLRLEGRSEFVFRDGRIYRLVDRS